MSHYPTMIRGCWSAILSSVVALSQALAVTETEAHAALTPAEPMARLHVAEELEAELVLNEPEITQPVFLNFDERGRMWVVEYRQYPQPAGLQVVSHDQFWRAVYDKVPQPPPHHTRGADRISIHEDTDGDGSFDSHKVFVDGLSIATAVERGRGGVWVLNPPYLLFYADTNGDDVPDGDPIVHLAGFGIEDTHSVANSLRWGPDGWLYGAQGSTVTGHMIRPGIDAAPFLHTMGQGIWRYHPETRCFEFFAEGGGNTFGVELDAKGRIFSGHNGGDTRGFHYMQGAYLRKGFEKHGPLSNPYAFGFFEPMAHHKVERFTHNFVIYEGGALPVAYDGKLLGIEPLQGRVVMSEITADGATFRTRDLSRPLTSDDRWFRPVDIKVGPDGALFICDWSDPQIAHFRSADGSMEHAQGRIIRVKAKGAAPARKFDLGTATSEQLADLRWHPNKWFRQTALRMLADRRDPAIAPKLREQLAGWSGQPALETFWALNASGAFDEPAALSALKHSDAQVRLWTVRLLCDAGWISKPIFEKLIQLAREETNLEVRVQLAASARRLPATNCFGIVRELLFHDEDATDARQPLMIWWAIESKAATDRDQLVELFSASPLWDRPLVSEQLLGRLMRRFAQSGTRPELLACARLLELSHSVEQSKRLMIGFEAAFAGRALTGLPEELPRAMVRHHVGSPAFAVRLGEPGAAEEALATIADERATISDRLEFLQVLAEMDVSGAVPVLLSVVERAKDAPLQQAALTALGRYDEPEIATRVLALYPSFKGAPLTAAQTLLASRAGWSLAFAKAVEADRIPRDSVPRDLARRFALHSNAELNALAATLWPNVGRPTSRQMEQTIQRVAQVLRAGAAEPYAGRELFRATCAACHSLFGEGGRIGPDLTTYQRSDVPTMLLHIVNPNAEIREGYENLTVQTKDGRALSGFLVERDIKALVLRGLDDQNTTLAQTEIASVQPAGASLMPEGLLDALSDQQLRDLFAYLRSTQPLVPRPAAK
ncbi:MAG: PVC-type heme-binding CxxCH protein [Vicinamibacterales bacterium]